MKKLSFLFAIIALSAGAIWLAGCSSVATTNTAANSNTTVVTNSAKTDSNALMTTDAAKAFTVDFKSEPAQIQAGQPVMLSFTVKDKQGAIIKDLPLVHEKPMHVLVVSKDLAEFYHIHPEQQESDGSYKVLHTFPNGGDYKIYTDFTPKESAQVIEQIPVKVSGAERAAVPLVADTNYEKTVEGLKVVMKPSAEIIAGQELTLDFQAFDAASNKPATDLQNYLGELAHFVLISQDMTDFVHAHPMSKGEKMGDMKMGDTDNHAGGTHDHSTMEGTTDKPSASEVSAHTAFPRAGLYKVWAQFQRNNKVITVPFVVNVKEGDKKTAQSMENVQFPNDAKKVVVSKNGFEPSAITFTKGEPLKIAFYRADGENCASEVVFKDLNMTRKLPVGEVVTVEIASLKGNEVSFACGMNMFKGKVLVQ